MAPPDPLQVWSAVERTGCMGGYLQRQTLPGEDGPGVLVVLEQPGVVVPVHQPHTRPGRHPAVLHVDFGSG